jgi:hypothetical protein
MDILAYPHNVSVTRIYMAYSLNPKGEINKLYPTSRLATNGVHGQHVLLRLPRSFRALRSAAHVPSSASPEIRAPDHDIYILLRTHSSVFAVFYKNYNGSN